MVTGPLAPFVQAYRRELRRRGYTPRSAVNELRQVARLSLWLRIGATLLCSFERYLLVERVLASGTVRGYVDHARKFLDGLPPAATLAE